MDRMTRLPALAAQGGAPGDEGGSTNGDGGSDSQHLKPFMGVKVRRRASIRRDAKGDYLDVPADPFLSSILSKRGEQRLLFADAVLRYTAGGKIKRRVLMISEVALYLVDPDGGGGGGLKRRIPLSAVDRICLSKLSDNFFAVVIPREYDCLMASTRKTEIVSVLVEASKSRSDYEIGVAFSNRFEYRAASDIVKEVRFEQLEGGIKTIITKK